MMMMMRNFQFSYSTSSTAEHRALINFSSSHMLDSPRIEISQKSSSHHRPADRELFARTMKFLTSSMWVKLGRSRTIIFMLFLDKSRNLFSFSRIRFLFSVPKASEESGRGRGERSKMREIRKEKRPLNGPLGIGG